MAKFLFIDLTTVVNDIFSPMSCFQCTVFFSMLGAQILMCVTVRICLFPFFCRGAKLLISLSYGLFQ